MSDDSYAPGTKEHGRLERRSFFLLLALVSLLFLFLLRPFWTAIFWACILALLFHPLYRKLLKAWEGRNNLAALATLAICVVIGVVPTLLVLGSFVQEGASFYQRMQSGDFDLSSRIDQVRDSFPAIQHFLERFNLNIDDIKTQLSTAVMSASRFVAQNAVQLGQGTMDFFINLGLMIYVAFFMLRDGQKLVALLVRALPLGDEREQLLFVKFAEVARATVKGNLLVALVQGSLGGIIFSILGIPGALLWGVVMTVLSLIPVVGAVLIWAPVAIYLFAVGEWVDALVLTAFGGVVIGLADNVLRPLLVGRDTKLPDYIVLLSTLGGFAVFGMNGFVIGPLIAALFVAFWGIFMREFNMAEVAWDEEDKEGK